MAQVPGASLFNRQTMQQARYWFERLPYTYLDGALAAGDTTLVYETELAEYLPHRVVVLGGLGCTTAATVTVTVQGPKTARTLPAGAFLPEGRPDTQGLDGGEQSTSTLGLALTNPTGAALSTLTQITWYGTVRTMTVAERLARGLALDAAEQAMAQQYGLTTPPPQGRAGLVPPTLARQLDLLWRAHIVDEDFIGFAGPVTTTPTTIGTVQPHAPGAEVLVWHLAWAAFSDSADIGLGITLTTDRDDQPARSSFFLDNGGPTWQWHPWLTAVQRLHWTIQAQQGNTAGTVAVRLHWYRVRLTPLSRAVFGLAPATDQQAAALATLFRAGVVI